jgi:hypothetical protein
MPMKKNYTLFYLVNTIENPAFDLLDDDIFESGLEANYGDIISYLDSHLAEISQTVVERLIRYSDEIFDNR